MLYRHAVSVRPSVFLAVSHLRVHCIVSKWVIISSKKNFHRLAPILVFFIPNRMAIRRPAPLHSSILWLYSDKDPVTGASNAGGYENIAISTNISLHSVLSMVRPSGVVNRVSSRPWELATLVAEFVYSNRGGASYRITVPIILQCLAQWCYFEWLRVI